MTPEPAAPKPSVPAPRSGRRTWWRWLLVSLVAGVFVLCGYGAWRQYDFRAAVKEAEALGWHCEFDDPMEMIRKDWKAAFRKETWTGGKRDLLIENSSDVDRHAQLLWRLSPKSLKVNFPDTEPAKSDRLQCILAIQRLSFWGCDELTDVDALDGLRSLHLEGGIGRTSRSVSAEPVMEKEQRYYSKEFASGFREQESFDIDPAADDRVVFRYGPISDSGVELERSIQGTIIWRTHVARLGVSHSIYSHKVSVRLGKKGTVIIVSKGAEVITESHDLETGQMLGRRITE